MRWTSINNQYKLVGNELHLYINDTRVVAVHKRQTYTYMDISTKSYKSKKRHEVWH